MLTTLYSTTIESPLGILKLSCTDKGVAAVEFLGEKIDANNDDDHPHLLDCREQLLQYFDGKLKTFHSLTLRFEATDFQREVWDALLEVPFGSTVTYGELASAVGHPRAARAVGSAMRMNPLPIIVPCHRVLPSTGITGHYSGEPWRKEWLLNHEKR